MRVHMYYDVLKRSGEIDTNYQLCREIFNEMERRGDAKYLSSEGKATAIYSLMLRIMFAAGSPSSALDLYTQLSARGSVRNSTFCLFFFEIIVVFVWSRPYKIYTVVYTTLLVVNLTYIYELFHGYTLFCSSFFDRNTT